MDYIVFITSTKDYFTYLSLYDLLSIESDYVWVIMWCTQHSAIIGIFCYHLWNKSLISHKIESIHANAKVVMKKYYFVLYHLFRHMLKLRIYLHKKKCNRKRATSIFSLLHHTYTNSFNQLFADYLCSNCKFLIYVNVSLTIAITP